MENFDRAYFKKLANQIMFDLSEQEIDELQEEFKILTAQMELLKKVDTEGVEPMIYPFEMETSYIREDEVNQVLSHEDALRNVQAISNGHVLVPKVVK